MDNTKNTIDFNPSDLIMLTTIAGMFNFGNNFTAASSKEPEATSGYMADLETKLIELNLVVASLLNGVSFGINTKKLLDIQINRLRELAEDIAIIHKINNHSTKPTTPEEPTIKNQTSTIQN